MTGAVSCILTARRNRHQQTGLQACALAVGAAPRLQLSMSVLLWPGALPEFCRWAAINP